MNFQNRLSEIRKLINKEFDKFFSVSDAKEDRIVEAMRYSAISTGKVLRPFLAITIGEILNIPRKTAIRIGLAIEALHTFSLIHDDLPAMDDDDFRRGKPSNHIQFGEATAILAGDGLETKAFEILLDPETHPDAEIRSQLALALSKATSDMIAGQMLDLIGETETLNLDEIERMQTLKTGALLRFSCIAPAMAVKADKEVIKALEKYAKALGLMFQITDDILDVEGDSKVVGKTLGKDSEAHKSTFVSILGIDKAKSLAASLKEQGGDALAPLGKKADILKEILDYILTRKK